MSTRKKEVLPFPAWLDSIAGDWRVRASAEQRADPMLLQEDRAAYAAWKRAVFGDMPSKKDPDHAIQSFGDLYRLALVI